MKQDFPLKGPTVKITLEVEQNVAEMLKKMAEFTKIPESEMANMAIKRFIAVHSDFRPTPSKP